MTRDEGKFSEAEKVLREALTLYKRYEGEESIHVVQTLADLGEVIGLQDRFSEASSMFGESLTIVKEFGGQYDRQEARTKMKYAEMLNRQKEYDKALRLLDEADDRIRGYGHYYDLLWRIELARAFAFIGKKQWSSAVRKLRAVLRYRREIGLPNSDFAQQFVRRRRWGTGLPR
jgi:tetratricopeptide (TPR) repeat protein